MGRFSAENLPMSILITIFAKNLDSTIYVLFKCAWVIVFNWHPGQFFYRCLV